MLVDQVSLFLLGTEGLDEKELISLVSPVDREYAFQFRNSDRRVRALASRALRLWSLKSAAKRDFPTILEGRAGKPYVEDGPSFSCSSTLGVAAIALSQDGDVGLDIESRLRLTQLEMSEQELIDWTVREAVAKGTGRGLALALEGLNQVDASVFEVVGTGEMWTVQRPELPDPWVASVAFKGEEVWELAVKEVRLSDLVSW